MASTAGCGDKQFEERVLDRDSNLLQSLDVARVICPVSEADAITKKELDDISDVRSVSEQLERLLDFWSRGPSSKFGKFCTVMDKEEAGLADTGFLQKQTHACDRRNPKTERQATHGVSISNQLSKRQSALKELLDSLTCKYICQ